METTNGNFELFVLKKVVLNKNDPFFLCMGIRKFCTSPRTFVFVYPREHNSKSVLITNYAYPHEKFDNQKFRKSAAVFIPPRLSKSPLVCFRENTKDFSNRDFNGKYQTRTGRFR